MILNTFEQGCGYFPALWIILILQYLFFSEASTTQQQIGLQYYKVPDRCGHL